MLKNRFYCGNFLKKVECKTTSKCIGKILDENMNFIYCQVITTPNKHLLTGNGKKHLQCINSIEI